MPPTDEERLAHMLDAAREVMALTVGKSLDDLRNDRVLSLALVRLVEIIGEAASQVSAETRARTAFGVIPWRDIADTRNRLIHGYHDVDIEIIYSIARDDLPSLVAALESASA